MSAQVRFTAIAPSPVRVSGSGAGGTGRENFSQAVQSVARLGMSRIPARTIPTWERWRALQPRAIRIRKLIEVSSRKSMLSAKSETEPIASATLNSTTKYARLRMATRATTQRKRSSNFPAGIAEPSEVLLDASRKDPLVSLSNLVENSYAKQRYPTTTAPPSAG